MVVNGWAAAGACRKGRGQALLAALRALNEADETFVAALQAGRSAPLPMHERESLFGSPAMRWPKGTTGVTPDTASIALSRVRPAP
jgi:hypothetical protein